jgi:RND family efflux transporter MFP subunit
MRFSLNTWSCLTIGALSLGVMAVGQNFSLAWQNTNPRPRTSNLEFDDSDQEAQVTRGPGFVTLKKCSVKLIATAVLASDRPGLIASVEPKEGDDVRKDQKLVLLKDEVAIAIFQISKEKSENDVNKRFAEASAAVAKAEWEKMLESNRKVPGSIPSIEVERARLNYVKAMLQGEMAAHELKVATLEKEKAFADLQTYKIEAPFDGKVRKVHKHKGEAVTQGTPILELVNTKLVKVEGYLPLEDLWNVRRGDLVEVRVDIPDRDLDIEKEVFEGKIYFVEPSVSPVTHGARVWAEVQNSGERLIEGLYANMTIKHGRASGTAKKTGSVPDSAGIRQTSGNR